MQQKLNFFFSNLEKIQKARFSKHRLQVSHLQFLGVYTLQKTFPKMSIPEASTPSLLWRSLRSSKSFSRYSVSSILPTIFLITPRMYMPCLQHRVHLVNLSLLSRFKGRPSVPVDWSAFEHKIKNKEMVFWGILLFILPLLFALCGLWARDIYTYFFVLLLSRPKDEWKIRYILLSVLYVHSCICHGSFT